MLLMSFEEKTRSTQLHNSFLKYKKIFLVFQKKSIFLNKRIMNKRTTEIIPGSSPLPLQKSGWGGEKSTHYFSANKK